MSSSAETFRFGTFVLSIPERRLQRDGQQIDLQPRAFDTLVFLLQNADRVVSKDELLDQVWSGSVVTENAVARVISALRKALDDRAKPSRVIRAIPRVGYQFVAPLQEAESAARALAVLPFRHLPATPEDSGLGVGIAEALITRLSQLPDLVVRPLDTARNALEELNDPLEAARFLRASEYIEGSVQQSGGRVRVSTRLLSTTDEKPYWSEVVDEPSDDIFAIQDAICEKVVAALTPSRSLPGPSTPVTESEAYGAYLEGRFFLGRATPADAERARERFESALDVDPGYGPAWAGIAECHDYLGTIGIATAEHFASARRAATRALALQPGLANAMNVLGRIAWQHDWDWSNAEQIFEDAIRQHPGNAALKIAFSDFLSFVLKDERAIEQAEQALKIDPVSPWVNTLLAQALYMQGEYDRAARQIDRTLEFDADFAFAHFFNGFIEMARGNTDAAITSLQRALESGRPDFFGAYGACLGLAGRTDEAQAVLDAILAEGDRAPPIARAVVYAGMQRYDEAEADFAQCIADRDWHILILHADPLFAELATRPQFTRLLDPLDLPQRSQR